MFLAPALVPGLVAQAPAALPEAPLSSAERKQAQRLPAESRQALLKVAGGLTPAQWTFKPAPDRWSIQEGAQHIVLVEQTSRPRCSPRGWLAAGAPGAGGGEGHGRLPDRGAL